MGGREGDGEVNGDMDECEANGEKGGIVDGDEGDDDGDEGDDDGDEGDDDGDEGDDDGEGAEGESERDRENDVGATTPSSGSTGKQSVHFRDECTTYPTPVRALRVSAA